MSALLFHETVTGEAVVSNLPAGGGVQVLTSADVEIAFWDTVVKAYGVALEVPAPGGHVGTPTNRAKITGNATVRIVTDSSGQ